MALSHINTHSTPKNAAEMSAIGNLPIVADWTQIQSRKGRAGWELRCPRCGQWVGALWHTRAHVAGVCWGCLKA